MTTNSAKVREVVVAPLAARREALALIGMIGLIILLMSIRFAAVRTPESQKSIKKYQQKETVLRNQAPTLYRSLLSVIEDITDLYTETMEKLHASNMKLFSYPSEMKVFTSLSDLTSY